MTGRKALHLTCAALLLLLVSCGSDDVPSPSAEAPRLETAKQPVAETSELTAVPPGSTIPAPPPPEEAKPPAAQPEKGTAPEMIETASVIERIVKAQEEGRLTSKEVVMLKAKLLHNPSLIPEDSEFRPRPGEKISREWCLTGFGKEVHLAFREFTKEDRDLLKTLSPDLEAVIAQKEKEQGLTP